MLARTGFAAAVACCLACTGDIAPSPRQHATPRPSDEGGEPAPAARPPTSMMAGSSGSPAVGPPAGGAPAQPPAGGAPAQPAARVTDGTDYLAGFPKGQASFEAVCGRSHDDAITRALCARPASSIKSLVDLQRALGLAFERDDQPYFALTGNSTGLTTRSVSGVNPRAIIFTAFPKRAAGTPFVAMGYSRGDQGVELVARDARTKRFAFFLVRYEQSCNASKSCTPYDLLGPDTETGFTEVSLYDDADLANTPFDCLQCHEPDGPGSKRILRMQEISAPWTHWFLTRNASGTLYGDFVQVHGRSEAYAGIPPETLLADNVSLPPHLEDLVRTESGGGTPGGVDPPLNFTGGDQPNFYDSLEINERGHKDVWDDAYRHVLAGEVIPMPYHEIRVTDPAKLDALAQSYQGARAGKVAKRDMRDPRDAFLAEGLADMGFAAQPTLDGRGVMRQLCEHCHNNRLDQTLSRARFNVTKLDQMSRAEKDEAIRRVQLPDDSPRLMPPRLAASLDARAKQLVIDALRK